MKIFLLLTMYFLGMVDDYYLQGILARLKQKECWSDEILYQHDYIVALIQHSFSWTFMVMLPIMCWMIYSKQIDIYSYCIVFVCNVIIHAFIDNLKANDKEINLAADQSIHLVQIVITWLVFNC